MGLKYITPGPQHSQTPTGALRYVTSGELPAGAGTGDAVKAGYNLWSGPSNVWTTPVTFSGVALFAGAYAGSVTGANRLITSGELQPASAGSGDATRTSPNTFTALNVFAAQTVTSGVLNAQGRVLISGGLTAYAPLLDNAGRRFLVSGEGGGSSGAGDATRTSANYFTALNVFSGATVASGNLVAAGGLQVSGNFTTYGPLLTGAGQRFVTSGEMVVIPSGITTINDQAGPAITFATAFTGTDFAVSAAGNVVTFTLPNASPFSRGKITLGAQTFSGVKGFADSVVALGGVQISGTSIAYAPIHAGIVAGATRLVTSGELVVIPSGLTTLNAQTGPAVTINTGTTGQDFNVSTAANVITANLPDAGPFARGAMTFGAQTFSGMKGFAGGLFSQNGTQASGVLLTYAGAYAGQVSAASRYITSGELTTGGATSPSSPADSVQFNNAGSFGGDAALTWQAAADILTVSGQTVAYGGIWARPDLSGSTRFVTSGELTAAGTGDFVKANAAYISGSPIVFAGLVAVSGSLQVGGGTQISGGFLAYGPLYQRSVTGGARYVVSGEMVVIPSGLTTLNSQTGPAVTIAVGSTGNDLNVAAAANVVTVHVPDASAFARGVVTTSTQTISGVKRWADNQVALTTTQASGVLLTFAGAYAGSVGGPTRYVTSGELSAAGTGDATRGNQNYFAALNVFAGPLAVSGSLIAGGGTQISGAFIAYNPLYQRTVTGAQRYLVSGEVVVIPSGITTVQGQTGPAVTFAVDQAGSDFGVGAAANIVTFSLPDASVISRGVITTGGQAIAGDKTLTGRLSVGADTQLSGVTLQYGALYGGAIGGATRYVTSGELAAPTAGSGDFVRAQDNYVTGGQQVFAASATVAISGTLAIRNAANVGTRLSAVPDNIFGAFWFFTGSGVIGGPCTYTAPVTYQNDARFTLGNVQLSGTTLHYSPIYAQQVAGPQRYLPSGEIGGGSITRVAATNANNPRTSATATTSVFTATIPGNTLVSGQAYILELFGDVNAGATTAFSVVLTYGNTLLFSGAVTGVNSTNRGPLYVYNVLSAINPASQYTQTQYTQQAQTNTTVLSGINTAGLTGNTRMALIPVLNVDATQDQTFNVSFRVDQAASNMTCRLAKLTYCP